jgi:hypothetical protein
VRKILTIGSQKLRQYSKPLTQKEINSAETRQIVRDMAATLREMKGAALSAPQIGVFKQIILFDIPKMDYHFDKWTHSVVYNPRIEILMSDEIDHVWEECHSVPGLIGLVPRHHTCALFWTVRTPFTTKFLLFVINAIPFMILSLGLILSSQIARLPRVDLFRPVNRQLVFFLPSLLNLFDRMKGLKKGELFSPEYMPPWCSTKWITSWASSSSTE